MNREGRGLTRAREFSRGIRVPNGARGRVLDGVLFAVPSRRQHAFRGAILVLAVFVATSAAAFGLRVGPWASRSPRTAVTPQPLESPAGATPRAAKKGRVAPVQMAPVPSQAPLVPEPPAAPPAPEPAPAVRAPAIPAAPRAAESAEQPQTIGPHAVEEPGGSAVAAFPTDPSLLAQQVAAYEEASRLSAENPSAAVSLLRAFRKRWPGSTLSHEVDVRLVQALVRLGRDAEARGEARVFLVRYPQSARRAEMEAILNSGPRGNE